MQKYPPLCHADGSPDERAYQGFFEPFYRGRVRRRPADAHRARRPAARPATATQPLSPESLADHPRARRRRVSTSPTETALDWLRAYAVAGGHLVLGPRTGYADDEARARHDADAGAPAAALAGVRYDEFSNLLAPVDVRAVDRASAASCRRARRHPVGRRAAASPTRDVLATYDHPHFGRWPAVTTRAARPRAASPTSAPSRTRPRWQGRSCGGPAPARRRAWRDLPGKVTVDQAPPHRTDAACASSTTGAGPRVSVTAPVELHGRAQQRRARARRRRSRLGPWDVTRPASSLKQPAHSRHGHRAVCHVLHRRRRARHEAYTAARPLGSSRRGVRDGPGWSRHRPAHAYSPDVGHHLPAARQRSRASRAGATARSTRRRRSCRAAGWSRRSRSPPCRPPGQRRRRDPAGLQERRRRHDLAAAVAGQGAGVPLVERPGYAKYVSNWTNPYLYVLPQAVGSLAAGTLLMASVVSGDDYYYLEHKAADPELDADQRRRPQRTWRSPCTPAPTTASTWTRRQRHHHRRLAGRQRRRDRHERRRPPTPTAGRPRLGAVPDGLQRPTGLLLLGRGRLHRLRPEHRRADPGPDNDTGTDSHGQILAHRTWNGTSAAWSAPGRRRRRDHRHHGGGKTRSAAAGRAWPTSCRPATASGC